MLYKTNCVIHCNKFCKFYTCVEFIYATTLGEKKGSYNCKLQSFWQQIKEHKSHPKQSTNPSMSEVCDNCLQTLGKIGPTNILNTYQTTKWGRQPHNGDYIHMFNQVWPIVLTLQYDNVVSYVQINFQQMLTNPWPLIIPKVQYRLLPAQKMYMSYILSL